MNRLFVSILLCIFLFGARLGAQNANIQPSQLPVADAGSAYSVTFSLSSDFTLQWFVQGNTPPAPGLTLDQFTGTLSGTPTSPGFYSFTILAKDQRGAVIGSKPYSLSVLGPLMISPASFPPGILMQGYPAIRLTTTGGRAPYQYAAQPVDPTIPTALPPGLDISNGVLSGTPLQTGTFPFNLVVTDSALGTTGYSAQQSYSITIVNQLVITTPATLPSGATNSTYSQTIMAMGGQPPYTFKALQPPPPGLSLDPMTGVLSGAPTQASPSGSPFSFNVEVDDSVGFKVSRVFNLTIAAGLPPLQVSPLALEFTAAVGGDLPPPQSLAVTANGSMPVAYITQVDGGQANTLPQFSLTVSPSSGSTPGGLEILVAQTDPQANPLPAGTYTARILVSVAGTAPASPIAIPVTLTVSIQPAQLVVAPAALSFTARRSAPGTLTQTLVVRNAGGGGPMNVAASVDIPAPWITAVSPASGSTKPNQPLFIQVSVNTAGLAVGGYHSSIKLAFSQGTTNGVVNVSVSLFVADAGPILLVDAIGERFETQQGNSTSEPLQVNILNAGDPGTTVNWTAEADPVSGGAWLNLSPASGTATVSQPGLLTLTLNSSVASLLPAGGYYILVKITDPQSQNSPQYVAVILDVAAANRASRPAPVPEGVVFRGTAGGAAPAPLSDIVHTSSSATVAFQASTSTDDGRSWLTVSPTNGVTSTASPARLSISADQSGLQPGFYTGRVNIAIGAELRSVNVTFIVLPASSTAARQEAALLAAGCTPQRLVVTQTGLTNSFAVPAGWPETISVTLNDDCGNLITNGSVAASFTNGDPALSLQGNQAGIYTATWQPAGSTAEATVTVQAVAPPLQPGSTQITGGVAPNTAPVLAKGGTVNAFFRTNGALAPGTVSEIYGGGLAAGTVLAQLPLPTQINNTSVLVGGKQPPLFFVSKGQLDVEIPPELQPGRQYNIIVNANGALTLPDTVTVNAVQPGVGSYTDGGISRTLAQHADGSLVGAAKPAKPGEVLVVYLLAMGATNPAVKSGQQAPGVEPLARVVVMPTLLVNSEPAKIFFAGLTPGSIGLYQINFQVPKDAPSGDLDLVVTQNGVAANTTKLRVSQ